MGTPTKENGRSSPIARRRSGQEQVLRRRLLVALVASIWFFLGSQFSYLVLISGDGYYDHVGIVLSLDERVIFDPLDEFLRNGLASDVDPVLRGYMRHILSASTNLINIRVGPRTSIRDHSYSGIVAEFCPLNFTAPKERPTQFPTLGHMVEYSRCGKGSRGIIRVDFREAVELAREFDVFISENSHSIRGHIPTTLDLKGAVFHESRCGASLTANAMMALDPTKNRVYSGRGPAEYAMQICGEGYTECSAEAAANILGDVVYMMGRTKNPREQHLFFVLHPEATRTMEVFRSAFPTTPWIFLYREPEDALLSQGEHPAFSLEPSSHMVQELKDKKVRRPPLDQMRKTDVVAIHLGTFCASALRNLDPGGDGLGMAVKFSKDLGKDLADSILPLHFHVPISRAGVKRIRRVASTYDNRRDGVKPGPPGAELNVMVFVAKSVRNAAEQYIGPSFAKLQASGWNLNRCRSFKPSGVELKCPREDEEEDDD